MLRSAGGKSSPTKTPAQRSKSASISQRAKWPASGIWLALGAMSSITSIETAVQYLPCEKRARSGWEREASGS